MDDEIELPQFEGYFTVTIPPNLLKLLGGNVLKLRKAVTEYDIFLKQYGEAASITQDEFHNEDDEFSWVYYTGMCFMFPDEKLLVKVETRSKELFEKLQDGIVSGAWKIYLKGTAIVSKEDDVDNIDKNLLDVSIRKVESYWRMKPHSESPDTELVLNEVNKSKRTTRQNLWDDDSDPDPWKINTADDVIDDDDVPF